MKHHKIILKWCCFCLLLLLIVLYINCNSKLLEKIKASIMRKKHAFFFSIHLASFLGYTCVSVNGVASSLRQPAFSSKNYHCTCVGLWCNTDGNKWDRWRRLAVLFGSWLVRYTVPVACCWPPLDAMFSIWMKIEKILSITQAELGIVWDD